LGLDRVDAYLDAEDLAHGVINPLKTGIKFADRVTTVSPTYAREICEGPLGMGMEATLRARPDRVVGILNGVDYRDWDPRRDPYLTAHFGPQDLRGKQTNKELLIAAVHLDMAVSRPLIGMVTRLAEQKGIDLLFDALPSLFAGARFQLAGVGQRRSSVCSFSRGTGAAFPGPRLVSQRIR